MARNEEKAQSMLYRFREAQAAELGLSTRADRRPRMASACKSLRDCERWRGEILREISRKVSKIQDAGLSDYEVRDLNDEINKLMREKRHWENQIVALGGANYRRNVAMLDDDGKEVPGTKGYKYFGRAKDLPGVRELFQSRKTEEEEENKTLAYYKKFIDVSPAYFGDFDEREQGLVEWERKAEEEEWEETYKTLYEILNLPAQTPIPPFPSSLPSPSSPAAPPVSTLSQAEQNAFLAAERIRFLSVGELVQPKMLGRGEMEDVLLGLRKRGLLEEYFGGEEGQEGERAGEREGKGQEGEGKEGV